MSLDEESRELARRAAGAPADVSLALRAAAMLERAGSFDEAWDVLESAGRFPVPVLGLCLSETDPEKVNAAKELLELSATRAPARDALEGLAARSPARTVARLLRTEGSPRGGAPRGGSGAKPPNSAGSSFDVLAAGPARDAVLVALALQETDPDLHYRALQELADTVRDDPGVGAIHFVYHEPQGSDWPNHVTPETLPAILEGRVRGPVPAEHWRTVVVEALLAPRPDEVRLLPWIVGLLLAPGLGARARARIREITGRDGPPFDVDALARPS